MAEWKLIEGSWTLTYELVGSGGKVLVQSRSQPPHIRRYVMIFNGIKDPRVHASLASAKKEAERIGKKLGYIDPQTAPDGEG